MTKIRREVFSIALIILVACGPAHAEGQAEEFVKLFQAYCVETDSDPGLIDNLVALEKWEKQPKEMVRVGQAESSKNARGLMTKRNGQLYLINYSEGAGCGLITQGVAGPDVLATVKRAYKISDKIEAEEGFQRTVMMVLSQESLYAGSIIVVAYLPSEPNSVVTLAHLPKRLADKAR